MSEKQFIYTVETAEASAALADYVENYVDVPKFLTCCQACPSCGQIWSCPPYDFEPATVWASYSHIRLLARFLVPGENRDGQALIDALEREKQDFHRELMALESATPGSLALSCGSCDICETCARKSGRPCVHPEQMRCSIESLGGDVCKTAQDFFHRPILWVQDGTAPDYLMLVGALLERKPA